MSFSMELFLFAWGMCRTHQALRKVLGKGLMLGCVVTDAGLMLC